jgi:histidinol dehydrogenase
MTQIQRLDSQAPDFRSHLHALLAFETAQDPQVDHAVQAILADVKQRGDAAVLEYTCRFDKSTATSLNQLEMSQAALKAAYDTLPEREKNALTQAAQARAQLPRTSETTVVAIHG